MGMKPLVSLLSAVPWVGVVGAVPKQVGIRKEILVEVVSRILEIARGPTGWGGRGLCTLPFLSTSSLVPGPCLAGTLKLGKVKVKRSSGRLLRREQRARPWRFPHPSV